MLIKDDISLSPFGKNVWQIIIIFRVIQCNGHHHHHHHHRHHHHHHPFKIHSVLCGVVPYITDEHLPLYWLSLHGQRVKIYIKMFCHVSAWGHGVTALNLVFTRGPFSDNQWRGKCREWNDFKLLRNWVELCCTVIDLQQFQTSGEYMPKTGHGDYAGRASWYYY